MKPAQIESHLSRIANAMQQIDALDFGQTQESNAAASQQHKQHTASMQAAGFALLGSALHDLSRIADALEKISNATQFTQAPQQLVDTAGMTADFKD